MAKADIEVNNRRYSVACAPGQEARLSELGGKLDRRVRHIADAVGDIGEARLFLVAALSLLDELETRPSQGELPGSQTEEAFVATLTDAAARIDALAARLGSTRKP